MFFLDISSREISDARDLHFKRLKCFANRRLGKSRCRLPSGQCSICDSHLKPVTINNKLVKAFLSNSQNLEKVISGTPSELLSISNTFWTLLFPGFNQKKWKPFFNKAYSDPRSKSKYHPRAVLIFKIIDDLKKILDYDWFIDKKNMHYNAYNLSENLDRNTCSYCNRSYTSTVILTTNKKRIVRPTLDHWFPKFEYPLLSVSFQNLIPSCSSCNSSVKGTTAFNLIDFTHPYVDATQTDDFQFGYFYAKSTDKFRIFVQTSPGCSDKSRNTMKAMHMDEIYNTHHSELKDLLILKKNYSGSYIKTMNRLLGGRLNTAEVYRLLFGVSSITDEFHARPLSKFKFDILKKMEMLKND